MTAVSSRHDTGYYNTEFVYIKSYSFRSVLCIFLLTRDQPTCNLKFHNVYISRPIHYAYFCGCSKDDLKITI